MILGERDRERVTTAEIKVIELGDAAAGWQQRALAAEQRVAEEIEHQRRLTEWARDVVREAARRANDLDAQRAVPDLRLQAVVSALHELHTPEGSICRHCGFTYPCPTLAALPSVP